MKEIIKQEAKEFQDTLIRAVRQHQSEYLVRLKDIDNFIMLPNVFNPNYAKPALFLLDNLGVKKGDVVLDPFTGCGADAIFAVLQGAGRAVAIDKYTMPYLCASINVHNLKLDNKIDVQKGDLFDPLSIDEKFDLVIANPPFKRMIPKNSVEAAVRDKNYNTLNRFFSEVGNHLTPNGRIRAVFSNIGDLEYFETLAKESGFEHEIVDQTKYASSIVINVYEMRKE